MAKFHYRDSPTPKQKQTFSKYLSEDEELILIAGLSHAYMRNQAIFYFLFPGIIFGGIAGGIAYFLGFDQLIIGTVVFALMLLVAVIKSLHLYHANRYLFTTRRVMIKKGLFAVKLSSALFDKITHLEVDQSFIDRFLLHHGNIIINTAGMSKDEIILKYVDYPLELKNLLERLINREREQYGMRPSNVSTVEGEIVN